MKEKIFKRKFKFYHPDKTAKGGVSEIIFDPSFDRVPSSGEFVNSIKLAEKYAKEVFN